MAKVRYPLAVDGPYDHEDAELFKLWSVVGAEPVVGAAGRFPT